MLDDIVVAVLNSEIAIIGNNSIIPKTLQSL